MYIEFIDYDLKLSNGEIIKISELDLGRISEFYIREYIKLRKNIVKWIPIIPRAVVEEAKLGYDRNFVKLLGSPPYSVLMRLDNLKCNERYFCASYSPSLCEMKPKKSKKEEDFQRCWVYESLIRDERILISSLVFKWKEGFNIVIIDD